MVSPLPPATEVRQGCRGTEAIMPDNGKAERFIQTLLREWAYALPYRSSETRAADLPRWLRHYNLERPHASLARQAPVAWLQAHP
jgi:transposase InsO family protein